LKKTQSDTALTTEKVKQEEPGELSQQEKQDKIRNMMMKGAIRMGFGPMGPSKLPRKEPPKESVPEQANKPAPPPVPTKPPPSLPTTTEEQSSPWGANLKKTNTSPSNMMRQLLTRKLHLQCLLLNHHSRKEKR
jgi:hypothetical protein